MHFDRRPFRAHAQSGMRRVPQDGKLYRQSVSTRSRRFWSIRLRNFRRKLLGIQPWHLCAGALFGSVADGRGRGAERPVLPCVRQDWTLCEGLSQQQTPEEEEWTSRRAYRRTTVTANMLRV